MKVRLISKLQPISVVTSAIVEASREIAKRNVKTRVAMIRQPVWKVVSVTLLVFGLQLFCGLQLFAKQRDLGQQRLWTQSLTNGVQDEDEVAWVSHLAHLGYPREGRHLFVGYFVDFAEPPVLNEGVPGRQPAGFGLVGNKDPGSGVGQEEQVARVQPQDVRKLNQNLLGRMTFTRFQVKSTRKGLAVLATIASCP
jgi:hypothetical protein